jgi:hypothetical protein
MESIAALSLACNVIQVVDFASRLISLGQDFNTSIDGRTREHTALNDAVQNLSELYNTLPDAHMTSNYTVAHRQLIDLQRQTKKVVEKLQRALDNAQLEGGRTKWNSACHALKSVWRQRDCSIEQSPRRYQKASRYRSPGLATVRAMIRKIDE